MSSCRISATSIRRTRLATQALRYPIFIRPAAQIASARGLRMSQTLPKTRSRRSHGRLPACPQSQLLDLQHAVQSHARPLLDAVPNIDLIDHAAFYQIFERPRQMQRADAIQRGAQAPVALEADDLLARWRELLCQTVDEVDLRPDRKSGAGGRVLDDLDDAFRGAESVGFLADLPTTLRMHNDLDAGILGAHFIHVARQKTLVDGAVTFPQ